MSGLPRINLKSAGHAVLQFFDLVDIASGAAFDETTPIRMFGARHTFVANENGLAELRTVDGTDGPIGGWIALKPKSPRKLSQLAQVIPCKITSAGKATPIKTGDGSGWSLATDFEETPIFTSDGSSPTVGTFGLMVVGTDLFGQAALFFAGGGAAANTYKVTVNNADGTYTLQQYTYKNGAVVGGTVASCEELNRAPAVPVDSWVFGYLQGDGVVRFSQPIGC